MSAFALKQADYFETKWLARLNIFYLPFHRESLLTFFKASIFDIVISARFYRIFTYENNSW